MPSGKPDQNICMAVSILDVVANLAFFFVITGRNHHGNHGIVSFGFCVLSSNSLCPYLFYIQKEMSALSLYYPTQVSSCRGNRLLYCGFSPLLSSGKIL